MKKLYFLFFCFFFFTSGLLAQEKTQTLFSDENSYGGFGGPIIEFSSINGRTVGDVGGGGGFVVNSFFLGGYGLGNDASHVQIDDQIYDIHFGHGGFWLGYAIKQSKLTHLYTSFRIGWGETELKQNDEKFFQDNHLVLAPEIGLEINITNWFKVVGSAGYRSVSGLDNLPSLTNDDFSGVYGAITFRFGGFGDYHSYEKDSNLNIDVDF